MEIKKTLEGDRLTLAPQGRVDTITAPEFEAALPAEGVGELVLDLSAVDYMSSAGLRVLLTAHKRMKGAMKVANVQPVVKEVFEITGFADIFTFA